MWLSSPYLKKKKIYFNVEKYINQFSKDQISLEQITPKKNIKIESQYCPNYEYLI